MTEGRREAVRDEMYVREGEMEGGREVERENERGKREVKRESG